MLGKGRILCILLLIALVASPAFAIRYRVAPWARHVTHHWFDCNAWEDRMWSTPVGDTRFTWDPNWNSNVAQMRDNIEVDPGIILYLNPNPTDPNTTKVYCDLVINIFSAGKNHSGEWMEMEVDDVNMYIGDPNARGENSWSPLGLGKEGWAKISINDSRIELDTVHLSEYASPPNACDSNDPNNLPADPNTWTGPWPAHENQLFLTGTTSLTFFEPGFFLSMGGCQSTDPIGRKSFIQFGTNVTVTTAPPVGAIPGTRVWVRDMATLEWVIDTALVPTHCTVNNQGFAIFDTGSMISATLPSGPPGITTSYTVMTIAGTIANLGPLALHPTMPANWSLAVGAGQVVLTYNMVAPGQIEEVNLFYNNSSYDPVNDDTAIDTSKQEGIPLNVASYANVSNYRKGINGIMIDISIGAIGAADLTIQQSGVANGGAPGDYGAGPVPISVATRVGAGKNGSDRVDIILPDGDGTTPTTGNSKWLRVTVAANATTKLVAPYVFYYGLAVGETGNVIVAPIDFRVDASDRLQCRANLNPGFPTPEPVTSNWDFNRDGLVDATDRLIARGHPTGFMTELMPITFP